MISGTVIHGAFTIERTFPVPPAVAFAAFASAETKSLWGATPDVESVDGDSEASEFDFRVGGRERFTIKMGETTFRYDALYYDIVPDSRIVYAYEMYAGDARISVSVATLEFVATDGGTVFRWNEQGAYLDGIDGPEAPSLREGGTTEMVDVLRSYLNTSSNS